MKRYAALYAEFTGTFAMVFCGTAAMAVKETTGGVAHEGVAITWGLIVMVIAVEFFLSGLKPILQDILGL